MAREQEGSLARACSDVAAAMASAETGADVIREIATRAADVLRVPAAGVVITGPDRGRGVTVAVDGPIEGLYAAEHDLEEGPSYDARASGQPVPVPSLVDAGRRWPRWTAAARAHGIGAWLVVPSHTEHGPALLVAAGGRPRRWTDRDLTAAQVLADLGAGCAAWATELDRARREVDQLQEALDHRVVVEQAKGLLAGELGCSLEEAFEALRGHARARSVTVIFADRPLRGVPDRLRPPQPAVRRQTSSHGVGVRPSSAVMAEESMT